MTHSVLYYPDFEPPQQWLRSVLLFVDEIQRIIPSDAEHVDTSQTQRLIDAMPNAFRTIQPRKEDTHFEDLNFARLRTAFAQIRSETSGKAHNSCSLVFGDSGGISIEGHVWLSSAKVEAQVLRLLKEFDLTNDVGNIVYEAGIVGDMRPVNQLAANLIVAHAPSNEERVQVD